MPRNPDLPCADCGKLMWRTKTSLPAGQARCQPCRRLTPRSTDDRPALQVRCGHCGATFPARRGRIQRYCSNTCGQTARWGNLRDDCDDCGRSRSANRHRGVARCRPCAKAARVARWTEKCRRRRVVKLGGKAVPYTLADIASRDGRVCWLCLTSVDMSARVPGPGAPTIDHVVPVSRGGDDTPENVRLAHFFCNCSRGNRDVAAQQVPHGQALPA